jgi:hypothetical protein
MKFQVSSSRLRRVRQLGYVGPRNQATDCLSFRKIIEHPRN